MTDFTPRNRSSQYPCTISVTLFLQQIYFMAPAYKHTRASFHPRRPNRPLRRGNLESDNRDEKRYDDKHQELPPGAMMPLGKAEHNLVFDCF